MFSIIYAVMLKPLPYPEPHRLVQIWSADRDPVAQAGRSDAKKQSTQSAVIEQWRKLDTPFAEIAYYRAWQYTVSGGAEPERVYAAAVSAGFLHVLGLAPARGRSFTEEDLVDGKNDVALLSDELWRRRLSADPGVLGQTITLDGYPCTIVGVMPPDTKLETAALREDPDLYVPFSRLRIDGRRLETASAVGRLKPGASVAAAQPLMDRLSLATQHEKVRRGINLVPLMDEVASGIRPALLVLFGAAGCVLLIACANVANLMLAQGASRRQELAMRAALGAGRGRLARHLLAECLTLAAIGGAAGAAVAYWMVRALVALYPERIPRIQALHPDAAVFGFTLLLALITALVFGAVPAWRFSRVEIAGTVKQARAGSVFRGVLVAAQVAAALVLLVGAGLLLRSFLLLEALDPGYSRANILTAQIRLPNKVYSDQERQSRFAGELLGRVRGIPSVQSAAVTNSLPMIFNLMLSMHPVLEGGPQNGRQVETGVRTVTPDYFRTMGIGLLTGRYLQPGDLSNAVVVNRSFASQFFGDSSPVGKRLRFQTVSMEIVGVVPDIKNLDLARSAQSEVYVPFAWRPSTFVDLAMRTSGDPAKVTQALRAELAAIDRNQPLGSVRTMEQILDSRVAMPRFHTTLLGGFALLALLLAAVGIYGVIAYAVSLRTREIGIRMAIGARPADVLRMMLRAGLLPPLAGVAAGIPLALVATRALASFLYGVQPIDAATYAGVTAALLLVAAAAVWFPARRAMRVDPMAALRHE